MVERLLGGQPRRAVLDLDKGEDLPASRDEIDLTDRRADALGEDRPALAAQIPGRRRFGAAAPPLGLGACLGQRLSSNARS